MRTLRKVDLQSMAAELQVLRREEEKGVIGGTGESPSDATFTWDQFNALCDINMWYGGYVEDESGNVIYAAAQVTVEPESSGNEETGSEETDWSWLDDGTTGNVMEDNDSTSTNHYSGYSFAWAGEGIGVNAGLSVSGCTNLRNETLRVYTELYTGVANMSGIQQYGLAELYVNGVRQEGSLLSIPSCGYYVAPGRNPLGEASFDLSKYSGHIEIKVNAGYNYNSGHGYIGNSKTITVYDQYR